MVLGDEKLGHYFPRRQIALESHRAGHAKGTAERAADLGRKAEGDFASIPDYHRLGGLAIGILQKQLGRAVGHRRRSSRDFRQADFHFLPQLLAQLPGQVAHFGKIENPPLVQPLKKLLSIKQFAAEAGRQLSQFVRVQPKQGWFGSVLHTLLIIRQVYPKMQFLTRCFAKGDAPLSPFTGQKGKGAAGQ